MNTLYDELVKLGVFDIDAQLFQQLYGTEPDFISGMRQMSQCYFVTGEAGKYPPTGEPWLGIYTDVTGVKKAYMAHTFEQSVAKLDPTVQMAIWGAMGQVNRTYPGMGKRHVSSWEYIQVLADNGWEFRINDCNDRLEVNDEPMTDLIAAAIRTCLRDAGFLCVSVAEDAYQTQAQQERYHPVKEYLEGLTFDGGTPIADLAGYFTDKDKVFALWLRRWLIGAIAKVYEGSQNPMLVLNAKQGVGKSVFARWLGSGLPDYFVEGPINPDDKDSHIRLMSNWIWEVAELGSTTRKADREALKFFISQSEVTIRKPYGKYDVHKRAMASLMGTVNDEGGILSDKTGNRRFLIADVLDIDWAYTDQVDINQVWAEAAIAYHDGERWELSKSERETATKINVQYEMDDPIEGLLLEYFKVDPTEKHRWMPSAVILQTLEANGLRGNTRANSMGLANVMAKLGVKKKKGPNSQKQYVWGYTGVKLA